MILKKALAAGLAVAAGLLAAAPARAELVLSDLIVELQSGKLARRDIEVWNNSPERSYVSVEPREILEPGLASQSLRKDPDPEKLGLLVSPQRLILEPGQRKLVRIGNLPASGDREHVYRVMMKPVVAGVQSEDSGLKIVVGYDVLVLVRPATATAAVKSSRTGRQLTFHNKGNVSVEIVDGRQCSPAKQCRELPGRRLYPGASWSVELPTDLPAEYVLKSPGRTERKTF